MATQLKGIGVTLPSVGVSGPNAATVERRISVGHWSLDSWVNYTGKHSYWFSHGVSRLADIWNVTDG